MAGYLPHAIDQLAHAVRDPETKNRLQRALHGLFERFARDLLIHQRIVAKLVVTERTFAKLLDSFERQGADQLAKLLEEVLAYPDVAALENQAPAARPMRFLPLVLTRGGLRLSWFTTVTTFGTPQDVTMQELRVEMFYPADDATDRFARNLARGTH